jgi:dTDP-4-dehydrorhamnose reductase
MHKITSLLLLSSTFLGIQAKTILVFGGKTGWIGQKIVQLLKDGGHNPICAESRLENRQDIISEILLAKPDAIINAAGITGKPNVDWCEDHKQETLRTNVIGTLNLADVAYIHGLHLTNISTGCIYEYDENHPIGSGIGFTEDEEPNFDGSFYSRTKIQMEQLILEYPNLLNLRVKMPVSLELDKGFVGKLVKYKKLVNIPNSLTVLDDLLPIAIDMTLKGIKGNFNFVNPGTMSHYEVMDLYKQYIDPTHTYEGFSLDDQARILKARRANAELSAAKLLKLYPHISPIKESMEKLFKKIKNTLKEIRL